MRTSPKNRILSVLATTSREMTGAEVIMTDPQLNRFSVYSHLMALERIGDVTMREESSAEAIARASSGKLNQMPLPLTFFIISEKGRERLAISKWSVKHDIIN